MIFSNDCKFLPSLTGGGSSEIVVFPTVSHFGVSGSIHPIGGASACGGFAHFMTRPPGRALRGALPIREKKPRGPPRHLSRDKSGRTRKREGGSASPLPLLFRLNATQGGKKSFF